MAAKPKRTGAAARWPVWLIAAGLAVAFVGLVIARYVESKRFIYGLVTVGVGLGVALSALLLLALRRRLAEPGIPGRVALGLAGAGAAIRIGLLYSRPKPGAGPPQIVMSREILVGLPLALAFVALVLGAWVVYRTISLPKGGLAPWGRKVDLGTGILALAASLYTLGPLLRSMGMPLNHWTFLGLLALGLLAFLGVSLYERIFG